jgi:hypothetical protein
MSAAVEGPPRRVGEAFAAVLRDERDVFNEKFAEARRRRPDLDGRALLGFLLGPADGVVGRVAQAAAERARDVAHAAYDAALTLVSEKLAGPGGRYPSIDEMWERLLPSVGALVADQPARVIGSLTNAVFHLASTPGTRPGEWIDRMVGVAPGLASVADLLKAGEIAAWRAGLAHLREGALAAGDALAPQIPVEILGVPRAEWHAVRERLTADAWWHPSRAGEDARPRVAATVGGFRGFGGLFPAPPTVATVDGHIAVSAAGECWMLVADAFGATFHRVDAGVLAGAAPPPKLRTAHESLSLHGKTLALPAIGAVTSAAAVPGTIAVTGSLTHAVTLIAVDPGAAP